jgi:hypothetical protein
MPDTANIPYQYKESPLFAAQAAALGLTPEKIDNDLSAPLFIIARAPSACECIKGTNIYRILYESPQNELKLRIWFEFIEGETITLSGIEKVD